MGRCNSVSPPAKPTGVSLITSAGRSARRSQAMACHVCDLARDRHKWSWNTNGADCDDGDLCTLYDFCDNGKCVGDPRRDCNDGLDCTTDDR